MPFFGGQLGLASGLDFSPPSLLTAMSSPALPHIDIQSTFGAALIGAFAALVLYGITSLQTYLYYVYYRQDQASTKLLVALIWALDTLHICLVCHSMYHYLILNFANPLALADGTWSLYLQLGINVIIAFIVQCFFTGRVYILSDRRWWFTGILAFFVVAHLAFGLYTMSEMFILGQLQRLEEVTLQAATPFAISAVVSDVLIAGALCWLLKRQDALSSFKSTHALVHTLIIYAINRCLLTSVMAVIETVVFATMPKAFYYLGIDFIIGKLYANSLLATLNARNALRERSGGVHDTSESLNLSHLSEFHVRNPTNMQQTNQDVSILRLDGTTNRKESFASRSADTSRLLVGRRRRPLSCSGKFDGRRDDQH